MKYELRKTYLVYFGLPDQFDYIYWEDVGSLLQKDIPKVTDVSVDFHSRDLFPYNQVSDILPYFHALPKLNKKWIKEFEKYFPKTLWRQTNLLSTLSNSQKLFLFDNRSANERPDGQD